MGRPGSEAVVLTVDGTPAPKGSRTVGWRRDGSVFTRPAGKGEAPWVEAVAAQATVWRARVWTLEPPYAVALTFWLPRPDRPAHPHPSRHGLDTLVRSTLDGLVAGGLLVDDRHVTDLAARKRWAPPAGGEGVVVELTRPDTDRSRATGEPGRNDGQWVQAS